MLKIRDPEKPVKHFGLQVLWNANAMILDAHQNKVSGPRPVTSFRNASSPPAEAPTTTISRLLIDELAK